MSLPQDPHRPFFPFGNPFKMMLPKGTYLSPRLLALLNNFEEKLVASIKNLKPKDREDILRLSWMKSATECLCAIHTEIKSLITSLELPLSDWDEKWVDVYLDNSVKLLDVCIAFSSEISRLNQGHLFLQCALHNLDSASTAQFVKARSSLDGWKDHISSKNPRLEKCFSILNNLIETLDLPKIKNSAKGKVLMRAMYGVKVVTVFVCSVFATAFSGSAKKLVDLQVPTSCLWAEAFTDLQASVNSEIRNIYSSGKVTALKELEMVDTSIKVMYPVIQDSQDIVEAEALKNLIPDFGNKVVKLSEGLDLLAKEVDSFFQIVLSGRDALLYNLRVGSDVSIPLKENNHVNGEFVK